MKTLTRGQLNELVESSRYSDPENYLVLGIVTEYHTFTTPDIQKKISIRDRNHMPSDQELLEMCTKVISLNEKHYLFCEARRLVRNKDTRKNEVQKLDQVVFKGKKSLIENKPLIEHVEHIKGSIQRAIEIYLN